MPFIKTTLTDDLTGKNADYCFNTEYVVSLQPARDATILMFANGEKVLVDIPFKKLARQFGAKEKLD